MLGSLTVLPALLSRLGDRVDRLRVPLVGRGAADRRRRPHLGTRSSTASCAGRRSRRRSPPGCCWLSPRRRCSCTWRLRAPETFPQSLDVDQDLQPHAAGVPRHGAARERRRQGAERQRAGVAQRRSRSSSGGRLASGRAYRADHGRREHRAARSPTSRSRSPGTEPTPPRRPPSALLRETIVPADRRRSPEHRSRRHRD